MKFKIFYGGLFLISASLLAWLSYDSIRFAKVNELDEAVTGYVIINKYYTYTLADGACLRDDEFPKLMELLHQYYGRCDDTNFKLPDITDDKGNHVYWIKIR